MSYTITDKRKQTMIERVGAAIDLIDNQAFLPFYRGVQIKLERDGKAEEWGKMIATAKTKTNPSKYFAVLCKMVRDGTYQFVKAVKEVAKDMRLYLSDKLVKFRFGKYQNYWVRKASEFINLNSQADFISLLEYAERKGVSQKYFAKALLNAKPLAKFYQENILGGAQ